MAGAAGQDPGRGWRNWRLVLGGLGAAGFVAFGFAAFADPVLPPVEADGTGAYRLPGGAYLLGTDGTGRDLLRVLMEGTLTAIAIAALAVALGLLLGLAIGWAAAARPRLCGWLAEGAGGLALVSAPLVVAIIGAWSFGPHATIAAGAIGLANAGEMARQLHRGAGALRRQPFVIAARLAGESEWELAADHLMPNLRATIAAWPPTSSPARCSGRQR
ncbi:MAG: hypothetical protein P4M09_31345 [Devosia sp.]|nr:hypothetical protein [Devosia sp.]